jgi:1,4-dihydroxy-2-naphthoate octaprenyltransferase
MIIGDFLGPIIGGNISNKYGFKYSNIFVSLLCLIQTIIFGCYFKNEIIEEYYDGQKYIINDDSEKKNNYLIGKHRKNLSSNSYIQRIEFDVINQQYI